MSRPVELDPNALAPTAGAVLREQGFADPLDASERVRGLLSGALALYGETARPVTLIKDVGPEEFRAVLMGEGRNDPETLVEGIYPRAKALALFALTLGTRISERIEALFDSDEFPLGAMLDAVASLAADRAVEACEARFEDRSGGGGDDAILGYSPGYCGWHISGQRALFRRLRPGTIGIDLNETFLMTPLKSVTGVLISGPREIHRVRTGHDYCRYCRTRSCEQRMRRLSIT